MQKQNGRIGISGGTFDPIHHGHLIISEEIREEFHLDKIVFIPSGKPPHKDESEVSEAEHRFNMVCMATRSNPYFEVSRIEMDRAGYIYTVDTMECLKDEYGENTELFFITGTDIVWDLPKWKKPAELFKLCEFIVAYRPGYDKEKFLDEVQRLKSEYGARISLANTPAIELSSTMIRERVRNGSSIKYMVPENVEEYIYSNKLYLK